MARGRPRKYDPSELAEKLNKYTDETKIPIVAEFCYLNDVRREYLYEIARDFPELSYAIKRCVEKKETQLEKLALAGEVNVTMAVFSLKQLGWRDRQEIEHSGEVDGKITVVFDRGMD
jgi:ubiquinone/menaquinone biosynthesis C-methylase UbiE